MTHLEALVLGLVEGVTEFLPISSTGHLLLTSQLLGLQQTEAQVAFEVAVQAGAILAVLGAYSRGCGLVLRGVLAGDPVGRRLAMQLFVAFAITAGLGLALNKPIKERLFNLWVVAGAWIVGGIAILCLEARRRHWPAGGGLATLSYRGAVVIGLTQSLALCPGVSRSLATLVAGLLVGLSFLAALEFSFLLGGLTLLAASGYETLKHWHQLRADIEPTSAAIAFLAATVSAWVTVRWMLGSLSRWGLGPFGHYRIAIGLVTLALLAAKVIAPA